MNEAIAAIDGDGLENNDGNHQRAGRTERMIVNQTGREWCIYLARVSRGVIIGYNPVRLVFFSRGLCWFISGFLRVVVGTAGAAFLFYYSVRATRLSS
jgi:hypothetical protein